MDPLPTLLSAFVAFLATLSAGVFVRKYKSNIGIICAFSAGILISIAVFDVFPAVFQLAPRIQASMMQPLLAVLAGFFSLFAVERGLFFFQKRARGSGQLAESYRSKVGLLSTLEFCFHGFLEGLAIGVGFQFQWGLGVVIATAVISHDFCDGLSTLTLMLSSGNNLEASMGLLFVDAFAPVLGAFASLFFSIQGYMLALVLSFLAGSFIYMSVGSLLPESHRKNPLRTTLVFFLAGLALIFFLSNIANA